MHGSNRDDWTFSYTAPQLAVAAKAQRKDRLERRDRWEQIKGEVMQAIKDGGMSVDEGLAAKMGSVSNNVNYTTRESGPRILIDPSMQRKLTEAHERVLRHDEAARLYDSWANALEANPAKSFELTINDWSYFFGPTGRLVDEAKDEET
jgi:hypothetical protein